MRSSRMSPTPAPHATARSGSKTRIDVAQTLLSVLWQGLVIEIHKQWMRRSRLNSSALPSLTSTDKSVCATLALLALLVVACHREPPQAAAKTASPESFESLPSRNAYAGSASCKE